ncbi:MAG: 3'(2'),5'-bisphosphate nucleotidase [Desulfococcaceae bacterium]
MTLERELNVALEAVRRASELCREARRALATAETMEKMDRSPVTVADFGCQGVVNLALRAEFPHIPMIGEETASALRESDELRNRVLELVRGQSPDAGESELLDAIDLGKGGAEGAERWWVLDPIDGTKGFLRGDQYAVALALVERGEVILGVLGCPNFPRAEGPPGTLFYAVRGQGAFARSIEGGKAIRIATDGLTDPAKARFCESVETAHASHETHAKIGEAIGISAEPHRIDSQAKYGAVASGLASVYLRLPRSKEYREKTWDHAAGAIVVAEAGGRVTDFSGKPLDFSLGRKLETNYGILATNGVLHDAALQAVAKVVGID